MIGIPRTIMVPTDFSPTAEHAIQCARMLAVAFEAEIHLVHVRILLEGQVQNEELQRQMDRIDAQNDEHTKKILGQQAEEGRVIMHPHLIRGMSVPEALIETRRNLGCDLVVMGTNGRRGLRHLLLGSVAECLLRTADVPVITVREKAIAGHSPPRRFLVPHDFSERSRAALDVARIWAQALGARITLLHVVEPVVYPEFYAVDVMPDEVLDRIERQSRDVMAEAAAMQLEGVDFTLEVVNGRAVDSIVEAADPDRQDLVIMGTRGLSGLEHLLLGSVAEGIVRRSRIPVLTVRADEE